MLINQKEIKIEELLKEEDFSKKMHKIRKNGLFLSDEQIEILSMYDIPYETCTTITQLIHQIDEAMEDEIIPELDEIASELAEQNYYHYTNK